MRLARSTSLHLRRALGQAGVQLVGPVVQPLRPVAELVDPVLQLGDTRAGVGQPVAQL